MSAKANRWHVAVGTTLVLAGVAIRFVIPALLVAAMAPVVFIAVSSLMTVPPMTDLRLERTITPQQTYPGGTVTVTLVIENTGDGALGDLRAVDGVPAELPVVDGSPRGAVRLSSGERVTFEYTLRARHGEFEFEPVTLRSQDLSGERAETTDQSADGDHSFTANFKLDGYQLADQTTGLTGMLATDHGGEGLEFHGIRAYQPEDPVTRINWRQYARDRTLSTVDYRREEAAEVVLIVDARQPTAVARDETAPSGTERAVRAATEIAGGLLAERNRVGAVALGVDSAEAAEGFGWISPGEGRDIRSRLHALFDDAIAAVTPEEDSDRSERTADPLEIVRRLSPRAQVLLFTPLVDDYPVELLRQLRTAGHPVTVYTPDVTGGQSTGGRVAAAQRALRVRELQILGVSVVEWGADESLAVAMDRASDRSASGGYA